MDPRLPRRDLLKSAGLLAAAGLFIPGRPALARVSRELVRASTIPPGAAPTRVVRFAHLTDFHDEPELHAADGVRQCFRHVMALPDKPELVVTGGDLVFDSFSQEQPRVQTLWDLVTKTFRDECPLPMKHTLGNHDFWGSNKAKSKTTGAEPHWGHGWALDALAMPKPYHAWTQKGPTGSWRFIVLDSVRPKNEGYTAYLDEEQMAWLQAELDALPPGDFAVIISHVPIVAACSILGSKTDSLEVNPSLVHNDAHKLHKMFVKNGRVKLCLSGHIHQIDRVEFAGVTYICDGAVSGSWWRGPGDRCNEGYGVIDLFDDGTFKHEYMTYGWKAQK